MVSPLVKWCPAPLLAVPETTFAVQGAGPHRASSASSAASGALLAPGGPQSRPKVPEAALRTGRTGQAEGSPSRTSVYFRTASSSPRTPSAAPAQATDLIQGACGSPGAPNAGRASTTTPTIRASSANSPPHSAVVCQASP